MSAAYTPRDRLKAQALQRLCDIRRIIPWVLKSGGILVSGVAMTSAQRHRQLLDATSRVAGVMRAMYNSGPVQSYMRGNFGANLPAWNGANADQM